MHHMRIASRLRRLVIAGLLAITALPASAAAQEPPTPYGNRNEGGGTYTPPAIFVTDLTFEQVAAGPAVQGSFTVASQQDDVVGDIRYRLELLGPPPQAAPDEVIVADDAAIYDRFLAPEVLALLPGQEKVVNFSYTPPALPQAPYRLRVQITTSQGRDLGWRDADISLGTPDVALVDLLPGTIAVPEYPDTLLPAASGPNVNPNSPLTLRATARNQGNATTTVVPVVTLYQFGHIGDPLQTLTLPGIAIDSLAEQLLDIPLTASATPGVYYAEVLLRDEKNQQQVSPIIDYRWVVRGVAGHIISARLAAIEAKAGGAAVVEVDYAGAADNETTAKGSLEITLNDSQGVLSTLTVPDLELQGSANQGIGRLTLTRAPVEAPGMTVTLKDSSGNILDTYVVAVPLSAAEFDQFTRQESLWSHPLIIGAIIGGIIALLGIVGFVFYRRQAGKRALPPTLLLLAAISGSSALLPLATVLSAGNGNGITVINPEVVCANNNVWCQLGVNYRVELFINNPVHNGTYADRAHVPLSYRITWVACQNSIFESQTVIRYAREGGKHSQWREPAGITYHQFYNRADLDGPQCSTHNCGATRSFTAPNGVNLSELNSNATSTTLQFMGLWLSWKRADNNIPQWPANGNGNQQFPSYHPRPYVPGETYYDFFSTTGLAHVVNVWLNFPAPPPTPSAVSTIVPTPISTPTPPPTTLPECRDGIDNDGDGKIDFPQDTGCTDKNDTDEKNATVDLKINGQDGTVTVAPGTVVTLSWTSQDTARCDTGTSVTPWGPYVAKPTNGSEQFTVTETMTFGLHCAETTTSNMVAQDSVAAVVQLPQCSDGKDNDGDNKIDAADPACHTDRIATNTASYNPALNSEVDTACSDNKDNDGDGKADTDDPGCRTSPSDPGTYNPSDTNEADPVINPGVIQETE